MTQTIRALWPFARPYRRALALGAVLALAEVLIKLTEPWPLGWLVDNVLRPAAAGPVEVDGGVIARVVAATSTLCLIVGMSALLDYWSTRLLSSTGLHLANDVRTSTFGHLQKLSLDYHGQHRVGDLTARVTGDVDRTQELFVQTLAVLLPNALLLVGMFVVMIVLDPSLSALALVVTPLLVVATHKSTVRLKLASRRARKSDGEVASAAAESLSAIGLVQAFTLEPRQHRQLARLAGNSLGVGLETVRIQARFSPLVDLTGVGSMALVLGLGSVRVLEGRMRLGELLVFIAYLGSLYKPVKALSKLSLTISRGMAASERVLDVLRTKPGIVDRPGARVATRLRGDIELRSVRFSYGREPVLDGLCLTIPAGETVALVGPTGAGKSTIAALVSRLVEPQAGRILVDGVDIADYTVASLRAQVSVVQQDCVLLAGSIRDNIACGKPGATFAEVERAARLALVDEFSARLPDGLDTVVGERGANLSGGQRQRIAIARAILRDASILILDEPTSALDAASEGLIVEALENLPQGRTTLVIAHRLSTVQGADHIAVLEGGRIVEFGSPAELLATGGRYARMAHLSGAGQTPVRVPRQRGVVHELPVGGSR